MANPITQALRASRLLPTPHWQPRCDLCRLRKSDPATYDWMTEQLLEGSQTQEAIAAEISRRTGLAIEQPQISNHKVRHLDPTIKDAYETFIARSLTIQALGDMPAEEMAVAYAQLALVELGKRISEAGNKEVSGIASAIAALSRVVQTGVKLPKELAQIDLSNAEAEARRAMAEGDYERAFIDYVEAHYPELAGKLKERGGSDGPA